MKYIPVMGETLHLTDGTPIIVQRVYDTYFCAMRKDKKDFTREQAQCYRSAMWQFNGKRGDGASDSTGMNFALPQHARTKAKLEAEAAELGGTITWTDPDLIKARKLLAKHARPNGGREYEAIMDGNSDNGVVIKAILEALKGNTCD